MITYIQIPATWVVLIGIILCGIGTASTVQFSPEISMPFDEIGLGGSLTKGQSIVKGIVGNALHFDGTSIDGMMVPSTGFSAPVTISAWVRIGCPRIDCRLVSRLDGDKDQIGTVRFQGCHVQVWNGNGWVELVPYIAVNGSWQYLTIVFKSDGTATGYVNGREKKSGSCGFDFEGIKFGIGKGQKNVPSSTFAGDIDEFRIYHKVLSINEIKKLYSSKLFNRAEREDGTVLTPFGKTAIQQSAEPVRPGVQGIRPFWNSHSRRFIYAPAFDFKPVSGAHRYRFTATSNTDGSVAQFEADTPTADLSPIWIKMTAGPVSLRVEGLDRPEGTTLGVAGTRDFIKSPPFNGPYRQRASGYRECGIASLAAQFHSEKFQNVLKTGKPDYNFVFPCKFMGAMTSGMLYYAKIAPKSGNADQA
ncbi:MAG: LamG domain-containing protein, partial [Armatimonadota bacterium]